MISIKNKLINIKNKYNILIIYYKIKIDDS